MARLILAFVGRRYSTPETGHDDWASKETYEWLAANGSAVTRIGDISGEHAKDLGHPRSHTRGKDLDIFHYYTVPGTRNTRAGEGQDNYKRLVTAVGEAYFGNQDASLQVEIGFSSRAEDSTRFWPPTTSGSSSTPRAPDWLRQAARSREAAPSP